MPSHHWYIYIYIQISIRRGDVWRIEWLWGWVQSVQPQPTSNEPRPKSHALKDLVKSLILIGFWISPRNITTSYWRLKSRISNRLWSKHIEKFDPSRAQNYLILIKSAPKTYMGRCGIKKSRFWQSLSLQIHQDDLKMHPKPSKNPSTSPDLAPNPS